MPQVRIVRTSLALAGSALIGFHAWLLASQVASGRLEDPWVIFRWIAAAALVAALVAVRRRGDSLLGRKSVAIWVLAAVLHGPAVASDLQTDFNSFALPETVATTILQIVASAGLAAGLWLLAGVLAARRHQPRVRYATAPAVVIAGGLMPRRSRRFAPRPPPLRR